MATHLYVHESQAQPMDTRDAPAQPQLSAAGSLPQMPTFAHPSSGRRARLVMEIAILFVVAPLAMASAIQALHVSLLLLLPPVLIGVILYLLCDRTFSLTRELSRGFRGRDLTSILAIFLVAGGGMTVWIWLHRPEEFLSFPTYRPQLWMWVMVLYPLLSALPQELVYRTFFFHRYGALFGDRRWTAGVVNGALFGFAHVVIGNGLSIVLSGLLGLLLAYRYTETRSVWAAWLEHTLYGWLVFTAGLGRYFFTGVSMF